MIEALKAEYSFGNLTRAVFAVQKRLWRQLLMAFMLFYLFPQFVKQYGLDMLIAEGAVAYGSEKFFMIVMGADFINIVLFTVFASCFGTALKAAGEGRSFGLFEGFNAHRAKLLGYGAVAAAARTAIGVAQLAIPPEYKQGLGLGFDLLDGLVWLILTASCVAMAANGGGFGSGIRAGLSFVADEFMKILVVFSVYLLVVKLFLQMLVIPIMAATIHPAFAVPLYLLLNGAAHYLYYSYLATLWYKQAYFKNDRDPFSRYQ
jgi:hypothetical protein